MKSPTFATKTLLHGWEAPRFLRPLRAQQITRCSTHLLYEVELELVTRSQWLFFYNRSGL